MPLKETPGRRKFPCPPQGAATASRWLGGALCASLAALLAGPAWAQSSNPDESIELRTSPTLQPPVRGEASRKLPIILQAQTLGGRPDLDTVADGNAEFRRGGMVIRA